MIEEVPAVVFYAKTRGRRYLTKPAAIEAEARAIIFNKYPRESDDETGYYYDISADEPEKYRKMLRRLKRIVAK